MKYYKYLPTALLTASLLAGCKSQQWASKKIAKIEVRQPAILTSYCANRFPSVVYDSTRVVYKPGMPIISNDTIVIRDTINHIIYKYVTKTITTKDTVVTTQVRQIENRARVESLLTEREQLRTEHAVLNDRFHALKKWIYILAATSLIMIIWKITNWLKWLPI